MKTMNFRGVVDPFNPPSNSGNFQAVQRPKLNYKSEFNRIPTDVIRYIKKNHSEDIFRELCGEAKSVVRGHHTYICPNPMCQNGSHSKGTGCEWMPFPDGVPGIYCPNCGTKFDMFNVIELKQNRNYNFRKVIAWLANKYPDVKNYWESHNVQRFETVDFN